MKKFKSRNPNELLVNIAFLSTDVARLYRTLFDRKMESLGLNRSEWWLISYLCYFDGHSQQELLEVMDIGAAGMTKLIDRLEKSDLVRRTAHGQDRRSKRVFLTDKSRPIAAQVNAASNQTISASLSALTAAEQTTLCNLLTKLRNGMLSS